MQANPTCSTCLVLGAVPILQSSFSFSGAFQLELHLAKATKGKWKETCTTIRSLVMIAHKVHRGSDWGGEACAVPCHAMPRVGWGGLVCLHGVLFSSAAGGAYWPIAICCPSLGPFPSICGGAHRPLTTLSPSSSSLPIFPSLLPFPFPWPFPP